MHSTRIEEAIEDPEDRQWTLDQAYGFCEEITGTHYENFPVASLLVPRSKRPHVCAIYAFARTADDFADEPGLSDGERLDGLRQWRERLAGCYRGQARHPIFLALRDTASRFALPEELFGRLLTAFESDVTVHRFENRDDLLSYCRNSADPVGRLILLLFGYRDEDLLGRSDRICTALQLTNFWQDLSIDLQKDRVYLPLEDLRRRGVVEADLFGGRMTTGVRSVLADLVAWTQQLFDEGRPLIQRVGTDLKLELRMTVGGGTKILKKIRAVDYDVLRLRPVLSRGDMLRLLFRSFMGL
jgi:hydroxysqualene synthase